jgi:hypothetical protein
VGNWRSLKFYKVEGGGRRGRGEKGKRKMVRRGREGGRGMREALRGGGGRERMRGERERREAGREDEGRKERVKGEGRKQGGGGGRREVEEWQSVLQFVLIFIPLGRRLRVIV